MGTPAPDAVKRLVDRFDQDRKVFLSADYKEEQLRAEFLSGPCLTIRHSDFGIRTFYGPFFTALGWDMDNKQGPSESLVMPADVLGQVCEHFLGKVIRLTAGHQAKVEEEPKGLPPACAFDRPYAPRRLFAMQSEPRPALTEAELFVMSPRNSVRIVEGERT